MEKIIMLRDDIKDKNDNKIAQMTTYLKGDGATPVVQTIGGDMTGIIGYADNGEAIMAEQQDATIKSAQKEFMAEAIKEQKKLCVENGVDPDLVNILNAEKKVKTNE